MSFLSIRDIECFVATFYLCCEGWETHPVCSHQKRRRLPITNRSLQFLKLGRCKIRRFKTYSKVGLWAKTFDEGDGFDPTFIDGVV